jgi:hypothetical protein
MLEIFLLGGREMEKAQGQTSRTIAQVYLEHAPAGVRDLCQFNLGFHNGLRSGVQ